MHNAIIYAKEVGQPGEQQTETIEGSFPTRGSIYDKLMYSCIAGNNAFRKWKVTYWVGFFIILEVTRFFFFYVKSFVSDDYFKQPECAAIENDNQTVGVASTFTHERETEKKTRKCINHQLDEILS